MRLALKHPSGIDSIMNGIYVDGKEDESMRKFLEDKVPVVDELSDIELYALSVVIGIGARREKRENDT